MDNISFLHSVTVNIFTIRLYRIVALARHLFATTLLCLLCFSMVGCTGIIVGNTSGTISDTLMGVNAGPLSTGANGQCPDSTSHDFTAEFQSAGVTSVRTHDMRGPMDMYVLWDHTTDPSMPALFNWDGSTPFNFECPGPVPIVVSVSHDSNTAFAAILAGGFEPYLRIGDSHNYANQIAVNFSDQSERNRFVTAAMTVVKHFYNNIVGTFDEFEGVDYEPLTDHYVEIWNEPDNEVFWNYDRMDYFCLYCELAQRLKNTFNALKVGGPGGSPSAIKSTSGFAEAFLDYVSDHCPNALDFISFHIYDDEPDTFTTTVSDYRNLVYQYFPDSNIELHLTEYNSSVNTRGTPEAAVILSAAWIELQKQSELARAHYYRGASPGILSSPGGDYSLFYEDQVSGAVVHTPTGYAFDLWNEMIQHPNMVETTVNTTGPDIRVLGGCTVNDEYAFLIVNLGPGSTDWKLSFNNLPGGVTDMTIDGIDNSGVPLNTTTLPISSFVTIPEGVIHLVKTIN